MSFLGLGAGCGDTVSRPAQPAATAPPPPPVAHVPPVTRPMATAAAAEPDPADPRSGDADPEGAVGWLENPRALRHFYEALARLEQPDGLPPRDVRILQYGDSHTASDLGVAAMRQALQARFGDGGRGFVALGAPWKRYIQHGVYTGMSSEFAPERDRWIRASNTFTGDGRYGLAGIAIRASKAGARAWTRTTAPSSRFEIAYLEQPNGGSFDVLVDGAWVGRVNTRSATIRSGYFAKDVPEAPHELEVRARGDGQVRIFGAALDRSGAGVVVDTLGINGAQIFTALRWDEAHFAEQLQHRAPDLVILAYGTNESLETYSPAYYERHLRELLARIARAVPDASCLLLGPPDRAIKADPDPLAPDLPEWQTAPKILEIVEIQRRVAPSVGCAFYSQLDAMGGPGSMAAWASETPPRAQRDRVHLTREGYLTLAQALVADLQRAYDDWRAEMGLPAPRAHSPAPR